MKKVKPIVILPVAAALAALGGVSTAAANTSEAQAKVLSTDVGGTTIKSEPNLLFKAGEDLLGLIITRSATGAVLAQHYSHSSHSSHRSHYSSRY
jgi:hypothetical protein